MRAHLWREAFICYAVCNRLGPGRVTCGRRLVARPRYPIEFRVEALSNRDSWIAPDIIWVESPPPPRTPFQPVSRVHFLRGVTGGRGEKDVALPGGEVAGQIRRVMLELMAERDLSPEL